MTQLDGIRVAVLATDGFEESELLEPVKNLKKAGAKPEIIAPHSGTIQAFRHFDKSMEIAVDKTLNEAHAGDYDAVLLPGGALNADQLRVMNGAQEFIRAIHESGKPIAVICHGPWLLVSAGLVSGRKITSYHTIQDDIKNAGGDWVDQEVVVDGNLVSSRSPKDLPAFNREMIRVFSQSKPLSRTGEEGQAA